MARKNAAIREGPALILLDLKLPGTKGFKVLSVLKSFPNLSTIPVIAVTAHLTRYNWEQMLSAGCYGCIPKPIDAGALPHQIADFLKGHQEEVRGVN